MVGALAPNSVSANFLDRIVRAAVNAGARRPAMLAAIGYSDPQLRNPFGRMPASVLIDLFVALEREFGDPELALKSGSGGRPYSFSDMGFIAMYAPTVGDMIAETVAIQGFRHNVWYTVFDRETNPARLTWRLPNVDPNQFAAVIEFAVSSYVRLFRRAIAQDLRPEFISFNHQPRFSPERYAELLGCPVRLGAKSTYIEFDPKKLALPSPNANTGLQRALMNKYEEPIDWLKNGKPHAGFAYFYLVSELNKSPLKLDRLAASYGINERTMRRRLAEEGHPFRELLEKVRRDLCDIYRMENRRSMSEIAEVLGYAELSAFTRAHKNWYGQPPTAFLPDEIQGENGGRSKD